MPLTQFIPYMVMVGTPVPLFWFNQGRLVPGFTRERKVLAVK